MRIFISESLSNRQTDVQKIAELKKKQVDIVAKCKEQLRALDLKLKNLGYKQTKKLYYGNPRMSTTNVLDMVKRSSRNAR